MKTETSKKDNSGSEHYMLLKKTKKWQHNCASLWWMRAVHSIESTTTESAICLDRLI
ncbi:MAG: hypothetical protein OEW48_03035 [Phycisphaerae bacterium]|nr:hypothetical protein [Phycisphaerae bacterium]